MSVEQGKAPPTVREQLMNGAIEHIRSTGLADLSTRSLAAAGGRSTMCLYTKFQSRQGLLDAVYAELAARLTRRVRRAADPLHELLSFAGEEPRVYAFLFESDAEVVPVPTQARAELVDDVSTALAPDADTGRRQWAVVHGMVALARHGHAIDLDAARAMAQITPRAGEGSPVGAPSAAATEGMRAR